MAQNETPVIFSFSYAELLQTSLEKQVFLTRDQTELNPRGITTARLTAYDGLITAFMATTEDQVMKALVEAAQANKNAKKEQIKVAVRDIMAIARDGFGEGSADYKTFAYTDFGHLDDAGILMRADTIGDRATAYMTQLASKGLTAAMVTALNTLIGEFKTLIKAVATAEANRDLNTKARRTAGNNLYLELAAMCQTAAGYYQDRDEAKYNDYIIYNQPNIQVRNGTVQPGEVKYRELSGVSTAMVMNLKADAAVAGQTMQAYFSQTEGGLPGSQVVTVTANLNHFEAHPPAALGYDEALGFVKLNFRTLGTEPVIYRLKAEG